MRGRKDSSSIRQSFVPCHSVAGGTSGFDFSWLTNPGNTIHPTNPGNTIHLTNTGNTIHPHKYLNWDTASQIAHKNKFPTRYKKWNNAAGSALQEVTWVERMRVKNAIQPMLSQMSQHCYIFCLDRELAPKLQQRGRCSNLHKLIGSAHMFIFSILSLHQLFFWPDSPSNLLCDKIRICSKTRLRFKICKDISLWYKEISLHSCILSIDTWKYLNCYSSKDT